MKKIYTLLTATLMVGALSAQVTLFQDNFDGYAYGSGPVANDPVNWSYWSTGNSDAFIDSAYAFSGSNSCRIQNQTTDLVLPIGPFTGGRYALDFQMLIPSGSTGAYFNALHDWSTTQTTYEWGMDVFFDGTGAVSYTVGFVNEVPGYTVPVGEWFDVRMVFYLDVDSVALIMQGDTLFKKQWSLNNANGAAGLNQIAGVDFFGTDAGNTNGWYYIDDVILTDVSNVSVQENALSAMSFFPNPASNQIMIQRTLNTPAQLSIYNAQGQLVSSQQMINPIEMLSVADWAEGVYQLVLQSESHKETHHLLIQH